MADENMPTKGANPAPLGLLGFGMTTVLLSLHNSGAMPLDDVTLAMGVFVGGLAQLLAGIYEYRNGNTFGMVAFTLYGMFWLSLVAIDTGVLGYAQAGDDTLGAYLFVWGLLTLFLLMGTLRGNKSLILVFLTLTVTFFLLSAGHLTGIGWLGTGGGIIGLICGLIAMYTAFAEILAEQYGRRVLPF